MSDPMNLELRRTGITVRVSPESTALEALEDHGIAVDSMCRTGICGTCETTVLGAEFASGAIPASILSGPGRCTVRLCIAEPGPLTRLIIDL
ncbi:MULTISPECIES: 2Fe-2S iron-sulfur cluster binding domain-containing protein [unclassified Nocardia]|uniref:2Fe-2S iron-sulfur cluster-binding protein n=1 Tax=unclassified Nocardia TaxID=2637762 RepID=UPI001CE4703D|nr:MULTISPECIES: 2Fe-2S iron-sulfur cluster binding domain-containing protein [unclassified Nocardia]